MGDDGLGDGQADGPKVGFHVLRHYLKDLSVENPRGPLSGLRIADLELGLEGAVGVRPAGPGTAHEPFDIVELTLTLTGRHREQVAFLCEITYVAEVRLENIPEPVRPQILHASVPQALMPLVNRVLDLGAQATGYPGLELPEVDFLAAFNRSLEPAADAAQADAAGKAH